MCILLLDKGQRALCWNWFLLSAITEWSCPQCPFTTDSRGAHRADHAWMPTVGALPTVNTAEQVVVAHQHLLFWEDDLCECHFSTMQAKLSVNLKHTLAIWIAACAWHCTWQHVTQFLFANLQHRGFIYEIIIHMKACMQTLVLFLVSAGQTVWPLSLTPTRQKHGILKSYLEILFLNISFVFITFNKDDFNNRASIQCIRTRRQRPQMKYSSTSFWW